MATFDSNTKIIVLMGSTGAGKTTFINTLAPNANFVVGHGLRSCTKAIQHVRVRLDGKDVVLVDTQGFDDSDVKITDVDVLAKISEWLAENYAAKHRLTGIIYLHRISDNRVGGQSFRQLQMFRRLCGDNAFRNVVLATTMWAHVSEKQGKPRENELCNGFDLWKALIDGGARQTRFQNNYASAMEIVSLLLGVDPTVLQIQSELVELFKDLRSTKAGEEVHDRLIELRRALQEQLNETEDELKSVKNRAQLKSGQKELARLKKLLNNVKDQLEDLESGPPSAFRRCSRCSERYGASYWHHATLRRNHVHRNQRRRDSLSRQTIIQHGLNRERMRRNQANRQPLSRHRLSRQAIPQHRQKLEWPHRSPPNRHRLRRDHLIREAIPQHRRKRDWRRRNHGNRQPLSRDRLSRQAMLQQRLKREWPRRSHLSRHRLHRDRLSRQVILQHCLNRDRTRRNYVNRQ